MSHVKFLDQPPTSDGMTDYDRQHLITYLRLLDADQEGACWKDVVRIVFGMDPITQRDRARQVHQAHLERAQWMTANGYRELIRTSHH